MQKLSETALANKRKSAAEYKKKNYKRIPLEVTIEKYEEIKSAADVSGETVNGYIKDAINKKLSHL